MRVLITGGAGFIGSHLAEAFLREGDHVTIIDNLVTSSSPRPSLDEAHFIESDVCDIGWITDTDLDVVYHLASPASPVDYARLRAETVAANTTGTMVALGVAKRSKAKFVYASSSEAYGPDAGFAHESCWPKPRVLGAVGLYAMSKLLGENLVLESGYPDVCVARIFNTYGPHMRGGDGRVVPEFFEAAAEKRPLQVHGNGYQSRSFAYIDNTVDALKRIGEQTTWRTDEKVVNIGYPEWSTINTLAEMVCRITGTDSVQHVPKRYLDTRSRCPNINRLRARIGEQNFTSLEDGLRKTWEHYVR